MPTQSLEDAHKEHLANYLDAALISLIMPAYYPPVPSLVSLTTTLQSDAMITCDRQRSRARERASQKANASKVAGSKTPEHLVAENPKYVSASSLQEYSISLHTRMGWVGDHATLQPLPLAQGAGGAGQH